MARQSKGIRLSPEPNKAGYWEIIWSERGRTKRRSTGSPNHGFAQKVLANFILQKDELDRQQATSGPVMVRAILGNIDGPPGEDYWTEHVEHNVVDKETVKYTYAKLLPHFGHLAVGDVTTSHVRSYIAARKAGRIGRPSVGHTIARELSVLNAAVNHAIKAKRLSLAEKPHIELPAHSPPRERWLTHTEAQAFLRAARGTGERLPRVYIFVMLALNTASRKTALLQMKWDQVDFDNRIIYLNPPGRAQTTKRRATVPMNDAVFAMLEQAKRESNSPFVLGLDGGAIRTSFNTARTKAGLGEDVTPHTLRHTWGTWAAQRGVSFFDMSGVMGDSIRTIEANYAHHCPNHLRHAVAAVNFGAVNGAAMAA